MSEEVPGKLEENEVVKERPSKPFYRKGFCVGSSFLRPSEILLLLRLVLKVL